MCASKMLAVAFATLGACSSSMRVRKGASILDVKAGAGGKVMPVLESDFNPIGEGTIPGAHGLLVMTFGDGVGIHVEDLRAISISRRFPDGYTFPGTIHGQESVPERQRRNWLSDEEKDMDSPHKRENPGHNGFVEATMENINFIICPFLSTMVNEGALPLQQLYDRDMLQEATRLAGLNPDTGVSHVDGNFLNDPDGVQDIWNMEGFTNEHVTSTGIHDCITEFRFCEHEHPPFAVCSTNTNRDCHHPNRMKFEQFVEAVDTNNDNFITIAELDAAGEQAESVGIPVFAKHEEEVETSYELKTSGTCVPEARILDEAECKEAAESLGLVDRDGQVTGEERGIRGRPYGCTWHPFGNVELWGADFGADCGSLSYQCICRRLPSAVYVMTNAQSGNAVLMFRRDNEDGKLEYLNSFSTGGIGAGVSDGAGGFFGAGDPLGSIDSLQTIGSCLVAVNAGSDTVTSFTIQETGNLLKVNHYDSRGDMPVSIGYKKVDDVDYLVYVLNAGGMGSLAGFKLHSDTCVMDYVDGSLTSLGQEDVDDPPFFATSPSQVGFAPNSNWLVVNTKGIHNVPGRGTLSFYPVDRDGHLGQPTVTETNGYVPFTFEFDGDGNIMSLEAAGTQPPPPQATSSAVTKYQMDLSDGSLRVVQQEGIRNEAGCWMRLKDGCAVTTNGGGSLSTFAFGTGEMRLLESTADEVGAPIDLAWSKDAKYVYALSGTAGIYVYEMNGCDMTRIQVQSEGVPAIDTTVWGVVGLAIYN